MGRKTTRGAVSLIDERGNIRMRWRYEGKRYSLTLFQNTKKGLHQAKKLAMEIESDLFNDRFDATLRKCTIPFTGTLETAKLMVGQKIEGEIVRVICEPL